jgi:hypothetical protein
MMDGQFFGKAPSRPTMSAGHHHARHQLGGGRRALAAFVSDDLDIQPGTVATSDDGFQAIVTNGGVYLEGHVIKVVAYDAAGNRRKAADARLCATREEIISDLQSLTALLATEIERLEIERLFAIIERPMPTILVTNDDGISSPGLLALKQALAPIGEVIVLAPERNWSASSHAKTMHKPLRITAGDAGRRLQGYTCSGSPTDCVALAMGGVLHVKPDLVVSGINAGHNVGIDVTYSGTVACAMEAVIKGVPGIAVSSPAFPATPPDAIERAPDGGEIARRSPARAWKGAARADAAQCQRTRRAAGRGAAVCASRAWGGGATTARSLERHDPYGRPTTGWAARTG